MDDLCFRTKAIVQNVPQDLSELEDLIRSLHSQDADKTPLARKEHQITKNLDIVLSNCQRLRVLSNNEPPSKRKQIELVVGQMQSQCQSLRNNLQTLQRKRAAREQELMHRASLFAPATGTVTNNGNGATIVQIDTEVNEFSRLQGVGRKLDEMLLCGSSSLEALKFQGSTLKNSQRRLLDLANTLGLSNTVMRLIRQRSYQDKVLFYALAIGTIISMFLIWHFIRG